MKYRKRPVVIEAMQITDSRSIPEICAWAESYTPEGKVIPAAPNREYSDSMLIHTLEGTMTADPGDYIIRGVKGEFYPCRKDIFEATYQPEPETPGMWAKADGNCVRTRVMIDHAYLSLDDARELALDLLVAADEVEERA